MRQAAAADAILAAQKAVSRAERELESAGKAVDTHERHVSRLWSRVELLSELPHRTFKQLQQMSRRMRVHDKARNTLHIMELRQRDAMIAYLEAQLELRDAWMDEMELESADAADKAEKALEASDRLCEGYRVLAQARGHISG